MGLFLLAVALYVRAIPYEYVLDDQIVITDNDFTKKGVDGISDILSTDSFQGYFGEQKDLVAGSRYRPLSIVTFALEFELFGLNSKVSHIVNILLYALLAVLIFRVLHLLFPPNRYSPWFMSVAFIGSLLYVLHPIHTEAVANIKGRDEIMTMLGAVASIYAVFRYSFKGSKVWWISSALIFFLGLLSKENIITFMAVIPLCYLFFTQFSLKHIATAMAPITVAVLAYIILRYQVIGYLLGGVEEIKDVMNNPFFGMDAGQKLATIFYTLGMYLKLLIFPHPLTHDYYPYHIPIMEWSDIASILSLLAYIALGIFALVKFRSRSPLSFAVFYFILTLSIVSNLFFPIGTFMNERFLFMPSLGFCIAAGYLCWKGYHSKKQWLKYLSIGAAVIYTLGFTYKTIDRVPAWKNAMSLNSTAIKVSKRSARANCFMATALYNEAKSLTDVNESKRLIYKADSLLNISLEMIPSYYSANQMKSGVIAEIYKYDRDLDKLLEGFKGVMHRKPGIGFIVQYMEYLNDRGVDQEKLMDFYWDASYNILIKEQRRPDVALKLTNLALQLNSNDARINFATGKAYQMLGKADSGAGYLNKAFALDPGLRNLQ